MTATEKAQLRLTLGESIPPGGSESDTMFLDQEIVDIFQQSEGDLIVAALFGWRLKAAQLADLVDITEVGEQMKLSQLQANALKMVEIYEALAGYPRVKLHKIGRDTPRDPKLWDSDAGDMFTP